MRDLAARQAPAIQPLTARTLLKPMLAFCSAHWHEESLELARHALAAAQFYVDLAEPDEALGFLAKAFPLLRRQGAQRADDLAAANLACGKAHLQALRPADALEHLLAATACRNLFEAAEEEAPEVALGIALAYLQLGAPESALPFARWALGFQQRRHGVLHLGTAVTSLMLAQLLRETCDPGTAESRAEREVFLKRAISTLRQTRNDDPFLAHALVALGELQLEAGYPEGALPPLAEAVDVALAVRPSSHPQIAWALAQLGRGLTQAGRREEAEAALRRALAVAREQPIADRDLLEAILEPLARISYDLMRLSDHIGYADEAKRLRGLRPRGTAPLQAVPPTDPQHQPAFAAIAWRPDEGGDRQLAWLG